MIIFLSRFMRRGLHFSDLDAAKSEAGLSAYLADLRCRLDLLVGTFGCVVGVLPKN